MFVQCLHAQQRGIPALLQFMGDKAIFRIDRFVLFLLAFGFVTCRLEIALERRQHFVFTPIKQRLFDA